MLQRILFVTDSLMAGGTEHQLITLLSYLNRERFLPYVVCLYGEHAGYSLHFLDDLQKLDISILLLDLDLNRRDKLYAVIALARSVWHIRPHLIQAVNYHSNLLIRLARPFMPASVRLVGCVYIEYTPKQLFYEYVSSWICNRVVCNTEHIQHQLPSYVSTQVIPNGVDLERFSRNPDPSLRDRLSPHATYILLVLGRITRQKSPHLLVEAVGILKEQNCLRQGLEVWIVGESQDSEAEQRLKAAIHRNNLENIVLRFPKTHLPEIYYHAADVVVVPSLWEGLPNVILETLAAGKPLIVSEAANSSCVVVEGHTGWISRTDDAEHLAETLIRALSRDLGNMSVDCQKSVASFTVMKMVRAYEALYHELMARS